MIQNGLKIKGLIQNNLTLFKNNYKEMRMGTGRTQINNKCYDMFADWQEWLQVYEKCKELNSKRWELLPNVTEH